MNNLSKQEQEISYILSTVFNYYTSYIEILGDISQSDTRKYTQSWQRGMPCTF
ncbi:hypothetical protein [Campylobacter troglodytis]|uniref:hypothetical protein n=1 Tax=Campylobacter troglodytis TaxID=654363 RepID=UPI001FE645E6|nr:hypothetical protein [Campylobacter troglodytis]